MLELVLEGLVGLDDEGFVVVVFVDLLVCSLGRDGSVDRLEDVEGSLLGLDLDQELLVGDHMLV